MRICFEPNLGCYFDDLGQFSLRYLDVVKTKPLIVDTLNNRQMIVYLEPTAQIPIAFYSDATSGEWQGEALHLDTGEVVRDGQLSCSMVANNGNVSLWMYQLPGQIAPFS